MMPFLLCNALVHMTIQLLEFGYQCEFKIFSRFECFCVNSKCLLANSCMGVECGLWIDDSDLDGTTNGR